MRHLNEALVVLLWSRQGKALLYEEAGANGDR